MNLDNPATQIMKQAAKLKHKDWHPHCTPVLSDNLKRNKLHQSNYISKRKEVSSHSFHHTSCRNISNVTNHDKQNLYKINNCWPGIFQNRQIFSESNNLSLNV